MLMKLRFTVVKTSMTVDASVITEKHSIMEYLLSPLMKGGQSLFRTS